MAFTTSCFIRKNTSELREKLEEIGYTYGGQERTYGDYTCLYSNNGRYYECVKEPSRYESVIDCGTNEELFLALAALRDDTDYMSWFKIPKTKMIALPGYYGTTIGMDGYVQKLIGYEIYQHKEKNNKISEYIDRNKEFETYLPIKMTIQEIIDFFNKDK